MKQSAADSRPQSQPTIRTMMKYSTARRTMMTEVQGYCTVTLSCSHPLGIAAIRYAAAVLLVQECGYLAEGEGVKGGGEHRRIDNVQVAWQHT